MESKQLKPRKDGKPLTILDVLVQTGLVKSRNEGKRIIKQGGVRLYEGL